MASAPSQIPSETLSATATAWLDALGSLNPERLRSVMSPDYSHTFAPGSLTRLVKDGAKDREAMCGHAEHVGRVLTSFPIFPRQVWPNPSLRQVVVWADSKANFKDGAKKGPDENWEFAGEYIFVITMNEKGDKVDKVLEFLDSKATERAWEMMAKALKNLESQ